MNASRKKLIRWLIAAVLLIDLGLLAANWKLTTGPRTSRSDLNILRRQHALLAADVARGEQIRKELPAVEKQCDVFFHDNLRPAATGYSALIADWGQLARGSGIAAENISFSQHAAEKNGVMEVGISTAVTGDYPSLVRFINALQHSDTFYVLDSLTLAAGTAGQLKLNLQLRTFFRT